MKKRKKKEEEEEEVERKKSCLELLLEVSSPTIPLKAGLSLILVQVNCTLLTLNYSLLALENLNGRKCHHFSGSPVPVLY